MVYSLLSVGRRTPWNRSVSPSVRNAIPETLYLYPISAVREHPYSLKHGFAPILIAVSILKSGTVMSIGMSLS
jgi:hypothetical protein